MEMLQRCRWVLAAFVAAGFLGAGCTVKDRPATTQPIATDIDPATAEPDYWFEKPATQTTTISSPDYDGLLAAAEQAARDRRFEIDRVDYRSGLIVTKPLISKQFFEFWRGDVADKKSLDEASLATHRRTVRWQIAKTGDDTWETSPKVVVERFTAPPQRVTMVTHYTRALSSVEAQTEANGQTITAGNWYAIGRDEALERQLSQDLGELLARH